MSNITATTATINWTNSSAPQYMLRYRKAGTNSYTTKTINSAACNTSLPITGLKKNTSYYFSIRAICSSGNSSFSPEIFMTTASGNRFAFAASDESESITAYPSPVINELFLKINAVTAGEVTTRLFDISGRMLLQSTFELQEGRNEFQLETSTLSPGQYLITVDGLENNFRQRIIKQ
jgi:hypothetical protein